jgi:holin-like protein
LLFCQLVGEVLVRWLALPVPGPVIGMLLLFLILLLRRGRMKNCGQPARTCYNISPCCLCQPVPASSCISARVGDEWLALLLSLLSAPS